jgi:hypothetical protein
MKSSVKAFASIILLALTACTPKDDLPGRATSIPSDRSERSITVFTDPDTGCQYLKYNYTASGGAAITPRMNKDHQQICVETPPS